MARKKSGSKPGRESPPARAPRGSRARKSNAPAPIKERRSIEGWRTLDRKTRQHINDQTGEVLSDRQYRKRFLLDGLTNEKYAAQRGAPRQQYNRLLRARRDYLANRGIKANLNEIRSSQEMQSIMRDLKKRRSGYKTPAERRKMTRAQRAEYERLYGPDSDLARALADLGYRDHDARHFVGDS